MRYQLAGLLAFWSLIDSGVSQIVIPGTPGKSTSREIGGGASGGVEVIPKESPKVRHKTYLVLSESRPWTSTDGQTIEGKLIAFEDLVAEGVQGAPPPSTPEPPAHPTVVRNAKVRLLVKQKPVEVPLARLSPPDREFIERIRIAHQRKTPQDP